MVFPHSHTIFAIFDWGPTIRQFLGVFGGWGFEFGTGVAVWCSGCGTRIEEVKNNVHFEGIIKETNIDAVSQRRLVARLLRSRPSASSALLCRLPSALTEQFAPLSPGACSPGAHLKAYPKKFLVLAGRAPWWKGNCVMSAGGRG